MRGLFGRAKAQLWMILEASTEDVVEVPVEELVVHRLDGGSVAVDVVLEVFAQEAGAVPRQAEWPWLQEEAGALDGPQAEDELVGAEGRFNACEGSAPEAAHGLAFDLHLHGIRMQP